MFVSGKPWEVKSGKLRWFVQLSASSVSLSQNICNSLMDLKKH